MMNSNFFESMKCQECLVKNALQGVGTAGLAYMMIGSAPVNVPLLDTLPFWAFAGGIGIVAGIAADSVHSFGSEIGIIDKAEDTASLMTSALISSGLLYLAFSTYDCLLYTSPSPRDRG